MDPNKKKQRQDFDESKIIVDAGIALNEFWKTVPQDLEIQGVNVAKEITPSTDLIRLKELFGCYDILLKDYKDRFDVAFDKAEFIWNLLLEIRNIGVITPKNQMNIVLRNDEAVSKSHSSELKEKWLFIMVMNDIREGYNKKVEDYALLMMKPKKGNGEYDFDLSLLYVLGQGVAYVEIEKLLVQELERLERIEQEEIEDSKAIRKVTPEEISNTSKLIVVLDAIGIIDFLKNLTNKDFQTDYDYTAIARMISKFTQKNEDTIRLTLRHVRTKKKNDPYNSIKNIELFENLRREFELEGNK